MLIFRLLKGMTMPGHYTDHLDSSSFILTGSAYSRMRTEISHLRNKKTICKAFSFSAFTDSSYFL